MQDQSIPAGLCQCGCGAKTTWNHTKGEWRQWAIPGHAWRGKKRTSGPDYVVDENGCWIWQRAKTPKGYGQKVLPGQVVVVAHRWYYKQAKGPIPEGLQVDHLCRVRSCVNPDHLEAVTGTENIRRGNSTPLTADDVRAIKAAPRGYGTGCVLAKRYGVSDACISAIRLGRSWADIE